jgi:hypothetical protein
MGGNVPLGYDIPALGTRILRVNEAEAVTVRHIFTRYLELSSMMHCSTSWPTRPSSPSSVLPERAPIVLAAETRRPKWPQQHRRTRQEYPPVTD